MPGRIQFKAPWGRLLVVTSILATLLCVAVPAIIWSAGTRIPEFARFLVASTCGSIMVGCALFLVRGYTVTANWLLIHRLCWDSRLSLRSLRSAKADADAMAGAIRTFGNGGFFSFTGFFWSRSLRSFRAYVTDFRKTVVLQLADRTVVVSPEDPERFVQEIKTVQGQS
jgi:hypothetical protein